MKLLTLLLMLAALSVSNAYAENGNPDKVYPIEIVGRSWIDASNIYEKFSPPLNSLLNPISDEWLLYQAVVVGGIVLGGDPSVSNDAAGAAKDSHYRLWSYFRLDATVKNGNLTVTVGKRDMDGGEEIGNPLWGGTGGAVKGTIIVNDFYGNPPAPTLTKVGNRYQFGYMCWGAPHLAAQVPLFLIRSRTSVNIWHRIDGNIWVENGVVKWAFEIWGSSSFPTHCLYVNSEEVHRKPQNAISDLWLADPSNPVFVIRRSPPPIIPPKYPVPQPFP